MAGSIVMKLSVVVGGCARNIYLRNRPDWSRFGRKKAGNSNFIVGAAIEVAVWVRMLAVSVDQV